MGTNTVGYRFYPTDVELIIYFLKNKILGKSSLVDDEIREINICSYEPVSLPSLSKIKSKDRTWYFFSPKEYTSSKKNARKRTTSCGFWKATGKDRRIKRNGVEIGDKKTLVYYQRKVSRVVRTPWVMHEYNITCLPHDQRTYVICKIIYKSDVEDIPSGSNSSEPSHSLVTHDSKIFGATYTVPQDEKAGEENFSNLFVSDVTMLMNEQEDLSIWDPNTLFSDNNDNPNVQLQTLCLPQDDDEFLGTLKHVDRGQVEYLFSDDYEFIMLENCEEYVLEWSCLL